MNADAVVYSIKRVIDPELNSEQISFFSTIKDARATGDLTLHVINDGPDPILPTRLYWLKVVPPKHSKDPKFAEKPVGTGPYRFVSWQRGQHIDLLRNEDYWGPAPNPMHPPAGCRFQSRCPHATQTCRDTAPVLTRRGPGQTAACWNC